MPSMSTESNKTKWQMWTWFVRFIISGITFHHDANKLYDYSFLEFKGLHLHLKVDVVERVICQF